MVLQPDFRKLGQHGRSGPLSQVEQPVPSPCNASCSPLLRCDHQMAKKLLMYLSCRGDAEHTCSPRELEAQVARLLEQLDIQGCEGGKSLGPCVEEVSRAPGVADSTNCRVSCCWKSS